MSNKDIILDSFARLVTNVRESRTFIHNTDKTRKFSRRARHSQPPPLSQQLFALQRHYLELCSTISFTPSTTPGNGSPSPSSPRMWTEKRTPVAAPLGTSCAHSVGATRDGGTLPTTTNTSTTTSTAATTEGEAQERRGTSSPLLNGMLWDAANKQWIGNYTDADRFHKFGTIKPVAAEENASLISKIAESADMWYDAKEFKWKKRKKKPKSQQKSVTSSVTSSAFSQTVTSSPRARAKLTPRNNNTTTTTPPPSSIAAAAAAAAEDDEEDVFAGISIDVNPVEGDFTRGCFVLPQEVCEVFRAAGRRNDEELASWPARVDVLTQRYSNANIIRRMAIKKVLHDITLASVKAASIMSPPNVLPTHQPQHSHTATISASPSANGGTARRQGQQGQGQSQGQQVSLSPTTGSLTPGSSNGESPPLHSSNIYGSHSVLPPSLGTTPTPPPALSITPKAAATPHRLVLSVRGTKSIAAPKSASSSAGACGSGGSSNAGSKRNSLVLQKFSPESDGDESDPFADFEDDEDDEEEEEEEEDTEDTTTSSDDGSGFKFRVRHSSEVNRGGSRGGSRGVSGGGSVSIGGKAKEGSVGVGSVETRPVPLQPKGIRIKSLPLDGNGGIGGIGGNGNGGGNGGGGCRLGLDGNDGNDGGSRRLSINSINSINNSNNSGCGSGGLCLKLRKFDGSDTDLDQLSDFDVNDGDDDDDGDVVVAVVDDDSNNNSFMDDGDISDMVDNKTRSSSCTRSRSPSVKRGSRRGAPVKPLKMGGLKLSLRKFTPEEDSDSTDPFADFSDDDDNDDDENSGTITTTTTSSSININIGANNNATDDSDWDMVDRTGPLTTTTTSEMSTSASGSGKRKDSPLNAFITPREKVKSHHSHSHRHHHHHHNISSGSEGSSKSRSKDRDRDRDRDRGKDKGKEPRHRKNTHHFATIRQDGTIVMDDEDGEEEVYDPCAGFDDSVIVGYEDVLKNNPSECYDDFIDMDDNTDLVLKCRNGGGEFSDEENDEDISGLDLSNVDQLVIHKNTN